MEKVDNISTTSFTKQELILLNNALNEITQGPQAIEEWEFHARTGSSTKEAKELLKKIDAILG